MTPFRERARQRRERHGPDMTRAEANAELGRLGLPPLAITPPRRPIAAGLAETLRAATIARDRELGHIPPAGDPLLALLAREHGAALYLAQSPGCDPDLSEADVRAVLARCGLALPAELPATSTMPTTDEGAPGPPAGAPARPVAEVAAGRVPSPALVAAVNEALAPLGAETQDAARSALGLGGPGCAGAAGVDQRGRRGLRDVGGPGGRAGRQG